MATRVGTVIEDKYEVLKLIGQGGMSFVYLAMDKHLNKQWAIKEIKKAANSDNNDVVINSLLAEANIMKKLDHPAFPRIVDIIDNGETIYVIMDYIEGESLDKVLDAYGPQPEDKVIDWGKQLCDALAYLHSQKPPIIYRDMKPANVILKPEGNVKVIDFGIVREYKGYGNSDTTILGTKGYASPEHYGGRETDARSDIYTLGMTMHHLLTGIDPRPADYLYVPVRQWNPSLSEGIEEIINRCTAIDPEARYQSCDELLYDLQHPDQIGTGIKKKKKRRLAAFILSASLTVLALAGGIGGQIMKNAENNKDYDKKVNVSASASYETKIDNLLEATEIYPEKADAYMKMLETFETEGKFGRDENEEFSAVYNKNKDLFDMKDEEFLDVNYKAGLLYLYMFNDESVEARDRIIKAKMYFEKVVENSDEKYDNYIMADCYNQLGEFFKKFVVGTGGIQKNEPTKDEYEKMINSMKLCVGNMEEYNESDSGYIRLSIYKNFADILNTHVKGLANSGIEKNIVLGLHDLILQKAKSISVTQESAIEIQNEIVANEIIYEENINTTYDNTKERGNE